MPASETLIAAFTGLAAVALLLQGVGLILISRSIRNISARIEILGEELQKKLITVSDNLNDLLSTLKPVVEKMQTVQGHLAATSEIIHQRAINLDAFLQDCADAARLQLARIEDTVDSTASKIEDTFEILRRGIVSPITEFAAIIRGLKVGLDFLFRGHKPPSHQPHQDEEMFI